jgi:Oxidoreductase-like protein, N-terminal
MPPHFLPEFFMFTTIDGIRLRIPTEEPVAPESSDCCGSGSCCPCVWDYYRAQQKAWLARGSDADSEVSSD